MGKEKMYIGLSAFLVGALLAYLIGSGTASGQGSMQYFTSQGSVGGILTVMVVNAAVMFCTLVAYTYAGRHGTSDLAGVCKFYCGKVMGKLLTALAWIFNTCCFFFMISGFDSTLNQQWGLLLWAGYLIAVTLVVGTAVMGLQGIVNIIGKIGPVVVTFLFLLDMIVIFRFFPHIPDGIVLIKFGQMELLQAGASPILADLSFGGCLILLVAAHMASTDKELAACKKKYTIILCAIGALAIIVTIGTLGLCHLGNVEQSATAATPNLPITNDIFGVASSILGPVFAIIILLSIYGIFYPMLWTCVSTIIKDEKSFRYKLICALSDVGVFVIDPFILYETPVNVIMAYCGYIGSAVSIALTICWIMVSRKDRLATASGRAELS